MRPGLACSIVGAVLGSVLGCSSSEPQPEIGELRAELAKISERLDRLEASQGRAQRIDALPPVNGAQPEDFDRVYQIEVGAAPIRGNRDAPVTLVVYSGFDCLFCARANPLLQALLEKYRDELRLVFKHHPLDSQPAARELAIASLAAQAQGKFWEFHDAVFRRDTQPSASAAALRAYAAEAELDVARFERDLEERRAFYDARIEEDLRQARAADVREPPTLFIDGRKVRNRSLTGMSDMIDEALRTRVPRS